MPCRPIADTAVLDVLGMKIIRDDRSLRLAPAFLDVRIFVVWLTRHGIKQLRSSEGLFVKPSKEKTHLPP